ITSQGRAPGKLADSRCVSHDLDWNCSTEGYTDTDPRECDQRCRDIRQHMPEEYAHSTQSARLGRYYIWHAIGPHQQGAQITKYVWKDDQSNRKLGWQSKHQKEQGEHGRWNAEKQAA